MGLEPIRKMDREEGEEGEGEGQGGLLYRFTTDNGDEGNTLNTHTQGLHSYPDSRSYSHPTCTETPSSHVRTDAIPNASGSLLIDGADVSGLDRIPCFALAGQDSDLFRGELNHIIYESIRQSVSQSVSQSPDQLADQSVSQLLSVSWTLSHLTSQSVS